MWRREDEFARITGKWMQWDLLGGTCCWPDSVYTHFFLSLFFWRTRIEFLSISPFFFSPDWWQHFLVVLIPIIKMDQPVSSHLFFFFSRVHRGLCLFSFRSLLLLLFFYSILSYSPIHPFEFFSLLSLLFSMSPTSQQKKNSSERKCGGWTPEANPWIEKQKSNIHTYKEKKKKKKESTKREFIFFPFLCPVAFNACHWWADGMDFFSFAIKVR